MLKRKLCKYYHVSIKTSNQDLWEFVSNESVIVIPLIVGLGIGFVIWNILR